MSFCACMCPRLSSTSSWGLAHAIPVPLLRTFKHCFLSRNLVWGGGGGGGDWRGEGQGVYEEEKVVRDRDSCIKNCTWMFSL